MTELAPWPKISVVMPVRNEERWIERALASVQQQAYEGELEIIVVVGASSDRTDEIVERLQASDPRIRIVANPSGRTPSALNLGIRAARGDLVARVDAHGWIRPGYLTASVEVLRRTGADAVGGRVDFVGVTRIGRAIALAEQSRIGSGGAAFRIARRETRADGLRWGVFRREVFEWVGLFDEALERNQDDEFCYRMVSAGALLVVNPSMRFGQVVRSSFRTLWSQYSQFGSFRTSTFIKHRRPATLRQMAPALFVGTLVLGALAEAGSGGRVPSGRVLIGVYGVTVAASGCRLALRSRQPDLIPLVPIAIATMHVAYGFAFWRASSRRLLRRRRTFIDLNRAA
jgi:cellulose synthase/poly-beta-1,6-N-acetylglucosamine synthase-like glycosyltransferase